MTAQYDGNELYTIHIRHQKIQLSQDEINEIQGWDFHNRKDISDEVEEIEETIDIMYSNSNKLYDDLVIVINNIDGLLEDDNISHHGLQMQREKISVINQKLGEI